MTAPGPGSTTWSSPRSSTSTGSTTDGFTPSSACARRPSSKPSTLSRSRPRWPLPNNQSLYETRGGSKSGLPLKPIRLITAIGGDDSLDQAQKIANAPEGLFGVDGDRHCLAPCHPSILVRRCSKLRCPAGYRAQAYICSACLKEGPRHKSRPGRSYRRILQEMSCDCGVGLPLLRLMVSARESVRAKCDPSPNARGGGACVAAGELAALHRPRLPGRNLRLRGVRSREGRDHWSHGLRRRASAARGNRALDGTGRLA